MLYSFTFALTEGPHESNVHTGIRKVVKIIINSAIPLIPKITVLFDKTNQSNLSINWKPPYVKSKENNNRSEALKTTNAQKSEKLRIKLTFVLLVNERTITPNKGKSIRKDNIKKIEMSIKELNL